MKVRYHIAFRDSKVPDLMSIINKHRIKYKSVSLPGDTNSLISFDIHDDHVAWETISLLVKKHNLPIQHTNIFSNEEIKEALWCRVNLIHHVGYPQPENKWLSTRFTYADFDPLSGIYSHQIENFRIKKEPRLKNKHFMDLTWPHEIFAKKEVMERIEDANLQGFKKRNVIIHRTGKPSETLFQIEILNISDADAILDDHLSKEMVNGIIKFMPYTKGLLEYSNDLLAESNDFVLSKEWFGDGGAFREILVSQKVSNLIIDNQWRGISLEPIYIMQ